MKIKLFKRKNFLTLGKAILVSLIVIIGFLVVFKARAEIKAEVLEVKSVKSVIQADGVVTPQNQAVLRFQTGGKLIYLPFKEGETVLQGQVIAKLDTSKLEATLRQAEQDFTAAKAASDRYYDGRTGTSESYDQKVTRTALDATQNKAYDSVVKARQDLADAVLMSPIDGVITQEDVTVTNINVTSATSFTVVDPTILVFRANVSESDVDFISVGNTVTVKFGNDDRKQISGIVSKIYPDKTTLSTGQKAYQVDVESTELAKSGKMGQSGTVLIQSNSQNNVKLVPTWTILNHDSVWVLANNKPVFRNVTVGKTHGDMTEVLDGLRPNDRVIINPESIAAEKYKIL